MINNEFLNIKVSEGIDNAIDKGVERASMEIKAKKNKKRRMFIVSAAAVSVAFFTFGIANPAFASKLPIVGSVFEAIEKGILSPGNYSGYATKVNETVESNGMKVTLSEILCDGEGLYVTYKVESEKPFKYTSWGDKPLNMNQLITKGNYNRVSFSDKELDNSGIAGLEGKFVDDNTFIGVERYYLKSLDTDIPDEFDFDVKLNYIGTKGLGQNDEDQVFKGTWAFKVPVKVDKSISRTIDINKKESNGFSLDSITITPFGLAVTTTKPNKDIPNLRVVDDKNNEIGHDSARSINDNKYVGYFGKISEDCKSLRVVIYKDIAQTTGIVYKPDGSWEGTYEKEGEEILVDKTVNIN